MTSSPSMINRTLGSQLNVRFFLAVLLDMMTVAMVAPLLPQYCHALGMNKASLGFITSLYGVMQTVSTPVLGMLADVLGPRPILMVSLLGSTLSYALVGVSVSVSKSTTLFYLARLVVGGTRQITAVGSAIVTGAYVQGLPHGETRRKAAGRGMSLFNFAGKVGYCLGPALGGYLADTYGIVNVAWAATIIGLGNAVLMWCSVPTTTTVPTTTAHNSGPTVDSAGLSDKQYSLQGVPDELPKSWTQRSTPVGFAFRVLKANDHNSYLLVVMLLNSMAWTMTQSALGSMLGDISRGEAEEAAKISPNEYDGAGSVAKEMSLTQAGTIVAIVGGINALTQFGLPFLLARFPSYHISSVANTVCCLGFAIQVWASTSVSRLCLGLFVSALCAGVIGTINKSTFSSHYPSSSGGEVMSVVTSIEGFNRALAPLIWGTLASFEVFPPTAPCALSLLASAVAAFLYLTKVHPVLTGGEKHRTKKGKPKAHDE